MERFTFAAVQEECLPDDLYCQINLWIWKIVPRLFLTAGTLGNLTNIAVLCRKAIRSKALVVLALLAAFDLLYLWVSVISSYDWNVFRNDTPSAEMFTLTMQYLTGVSLSASNWTIAVFTFERLAVVFFPVTGRIFFTTRKTLMTIMVLTICQSIYWGIVIFGFKHFTSLGNESQLTSENEFGNETKHSDCPLMSSDFGESCRAQSVVILVTTIILPIALSISGNAALIAKFRCCTAPRLLDSRPDTQTKMLFCVTGFLSATIVATSAAIYVRYQFILGREDVPQTIRLVTIVLYLIHLSNYCFNFVLYLLTGSLFKREFKLMCREIMNGLVRRN